MDNIDHWVREINEDPSELSRIERDVNQTIEVMEKLSRGESIDFTAMRGKEAEKVSMPGNYSIARELSNLTNAAQREFVIIRDTEKKEAKVILASGASLDENIDIPGQNKDV